MGILSGDDIFLLLNFEVGSFTVSLTGAQRLVILRVSQAELQCGENMLVGLLGRGCRAIKCI